MSLEPGSKLGQYEILSSLGAGGMGEVYRARDTKLGREVAIKVLLEEVSQDPERLARFEREAVLLASLNHPNIATLYGFERAGEIRFLVMELVEGETLADHLRRAPLPPPQVLRLGTEIAVGLHAAHQREIVHRDLKPANIKIAPRGRVKILDFGLAKAFSDGTERESQDATVTAGATIEGEILGTPAYMSPEQVEGREADVRSDVFALGAVLYEMASGRRPFQGDSRASLAAAILTQEPPPLAEAPDGSPATLGEVIRRCMAKDPDDRWQSAHDVALALQLAAGSPKLLEDAEAPRRGRWLGAAGWIVAAAALVTASILGLGREPLPDSSPTPVVRFEVEPAASFVDLPTLSPDGTTLAYLGGDDERRREIWLRPLEGLEERPLEGTLGVGFFAFSPDGRSIAFNAEGRILTIPTEGGLPTPLAEGAFTAGGLSWGEDGFVYYPAFGNSGKTQYLWRVPALGGQPEAVGVVVEGTHGHYRPDALSRGRSVLFNTSLPTQESSLPQEIAVHDLRTGDGRRLGVPGCCPKFLPPRFLLFQRGDALWAVPYDLQRLEVAGAPQVVERSQHGFHVNRDGDLTFVGTEGDGNTMELVWVRRDGSSSVVTDRRRNYRGVGLVSPRGDTLSVAIWDDRGSTRWSLDLETLAWTRPEQAGSQNTAAYLTPDSRYLTFLSNREDLSFVNIFLQPADLSRPPERLAPSPQYQISWAWSPDGRYLLFEDGRKPGLWVYDRETGAAEPPADGEPTTRGGQFHPNGRWIAYTVLEDDQPPKIRVRPFPGPGASREISDGPGYGPWWSGDGRELFFRGETHMMAIPVEATEGRLRTGAPVALFEDTYRRDSFPGLGNYSLHPDGRFLMLRGTSARSRIVVVKGFRTHLEELFSSDD